MVGDQDLVMGGQDLALGDQDFVVGAQDQRERRGRWWNSICARYVVSRKEEGGRRGK